jgi:hypothetical protein
MTSKLKRSKKIMPGAPRFWWSALAVAWGGVFLGCASMPPEKRKDFGAPVNLPFMRMEANECYFIDDFLPTPDLMVTGKSNGVYLRYYTYEAAIYKIWDKERVMLAFYSRDNRCWSLFEEYKDR